MKVADIVTFDIETGGFSKEENGLAEIAFIVMDSDTLEEIDRYETIVAPYELPSGNMTTYSPQALAVNGLTMRQIEGGKDAKQVATEIKAFLTKHKKPLRGGAGKLIPAGHNIDRFDLPFLEFFLNLFKVKMEDLFNPLIIDTVLWSRLRWARDGSIANHQLGTSCDAAGIALIDSHRAMNDVEGNAELVRQFIRGMRNQSSSVQVQRAKFRDKFLF